MKVHVDYRDGHHWMVRYTDKHKAAGLAYVEISDELWLLYEKYRRRDRAWQQFMGTLDNEQYFVEHPDDPMKEVYGEHDAYAIARKWLPLLVG